MLAGERPDAAPAPLSRVWFSDECDVRWTWASVRPPAQALASGLPQEVPFEGLELGPMLGKGGYGIVYRGLWRGQRVAVKVRPPGCQALLRALISREEGNAAA